MKCSPFAKRSFSHWKEGRHYARFSHHGMKDNDVHRKEDCHGHDTDHEHHDRDEPHRMRHGHHGLHRMRHGHHDFYRMRHGHHGLHKMRHGHHGWQMRHGHNQHHKMKHMKRHELKHMKHHKKEHGMHRMKRCNRSSSEESDFTSICSEQDINLKSPVPSYEPKSKVEVTRENNKFRISLDMSCYKPTEISVKIIDGKINVSGLHENTEEDLYEWFELYRTFNVPDDVNSESISASLDSEGMLAIEADIITDKESEAHMIDIPVVRIDE